VGGARAGEGPGLRAGGQDATWLHRDTWHGDKEGRDPEDASGRTRDYPSQDREGEEDEEGALHHNTLRHTPRSPPRGSGSAVGD